MLILFGDNDDNAVVTIQYPGGYIMEVSVNPTVIVEDVVVIEEVV
jgi:hypothetical protein